MVTVSEVQARIEAIEATVASERAQVIAAVEEYIDRIAELIEAGSENGQDLSVLIDELDALEDRIKGIYEAEPVPVPLPNPSI